MKDNNFIRLMVGIILISASSLANADKIYLKNGDIITGEIKKIWDDEVTIEPTYSDEFQVDLPDIDYIVSDMDLDVELQDGRKVTARFDGKDAEGNQLVIYSDETLAISLADMREVDEIEEYFEWETHIDYNLTVNSGNTENLNSLLRGDAMTKFGDHRHVLDLTLANESQTIKSPNGTENPLEVDETTKDQTLLRYNYNWLYNDPWFMGGFLSYESDPIKDLEARYIGAAVVGTDIWRDPDRLLSIQLGLGYQDEEQTTDVAAGDEDDAADSGSVAVWTLRFRYDLLSDDLELYHNDSITYNISGRDNTSIKTTTGLRYEITDLFYFNTSLDYDYETDPLQGDLNLTVPIENEDVTLIMGLGLEFE
jgi:putative salt-induced outer membrane protein YdiY